MVNYINIYGVIGEDMLAAPIIEAIQYYRDDPETTELVVNLVDTPGGYSSQGFAIYDALLDFLKSGKKLTTRGSGFVGSISTVIFCAGQVRELTFSTVFYVHYAQLRPKLSYAKDLRKAADYLDGVTEQAARVYEKSTKLDRDHIDLLMSEEVYLTAEEAQSLNFATYVNNFDEVLLKSEIFMTSFKDRFRSAFGKNDKAEEGEGAVALALNLTDGRTANIATSDDIPKTGDPISVNGSTLEDGDYATQNGYSLTVKGGTLTAVKRSEVSNETLLQAIEEGRQERESLRAELADTQEALINTARAHVSGGFNKPGDNLNPSGGEEVEETPPAPKLETIGIRATMEKIRQRALESRR